MTQQEYKSIEQKTWDAVRPWAEDFIKGAYGTMITPFRVPTLIRKSEERVIPTSFGDEVIYNFSPFKTLGGLTGSVPLFLAYVNVTDNATEGNYWPLAFLATTNFASGIYEFARAAKKKKENKSLEQQVSINKELM